MRKTRTACGLALAAVALAWSASATAHTISFGSVNAGTPGTVTIWMGSYHGTLLQGSLTIGGNSYAFDQLTFSKPAGLIDGTNNFFASGSAVAGEFTNPTDPFPGLPVNGWQGVTVSGLSAGLQPYSISGMTSANWADWNTGLSNWTGSITIPGSSIGVPEPASMLLASLGLLGLAAGGRRRRPATAAA